MSILDLQAMQPPGSMIAGKSGASKCCTGCSGGGGGGGKGGHGGGTISGGSLLLCDGLL